MSVSRFATKPITITDYSAPTMHFSIPRLQTLLSVSDNSPNRQAKLDNLICEERVDDPRLQGYQNFLSPEIMDDMPFDGDPSSWLALHDRYYRQHITIRDSLTFLQASKLTVRASIPAEDWIVRVERIDNAFKDWDKGSESGKSAIETLTEWTETLKDAAVSKKPSPSRISSLAGLGALLGKASTPTPSASALELIEYWNKSVRKDYRPTFVAFEAELKEELEEPDWPKRLCVRLGLGHHFFDKEITLALLRYRVKDVLDAWKSTTSFCAPTVLDSGFGEYFHPSPQHCDWGFAAVLDAAAGDEALVAELLHRRIDYTPEHLWRVGTVKCAAVTDKELVAMRNAHVGRLRRQSGRDDFGVMR